MHNLVPRFILEKYALDESGGRFQAVSLFADISGFSATTHALMLHGNEAVEAMADIMLALFEPLVAQIHVQGGFITTFGGDAFTALFPLESSTSPEQSYQRALAAAVAIQQHLVAHALQATTYGGFTFAIKLGLGDGEVEWGILRPEQTLTGHRKQRAAYFFSGPAIEAATAAEGQAQSGDLILSPQVYVHLQASVKVDPLADKYWRFLQVLGELPESQNRLEDFSPAEAEADFIPAAIRERESLGDFRQVVSVFIHLMGIETRQDLDIFMQATFELLHQFDGYLNRLDFGDKGCNLLLFWGMPTSHENDIQRALEFVLELGNHTPGSFRAGLTYHLMYAGLSGSSARGEFTCYGDGINLAARLMMAAPWGSLWLDEPIAHRAQARFVTEYVDHLSFKGFAEKQPVYALVERRAIGESFFAGRMIGRQAELAELKTFIQPIFAPAGERRYAGALVLIGEAGQGKSRLAHEFLTEAGSPVAGQVQVFICQTDQVLRLSLNPFRYWLQRYFDQSPDQSAERNKRAFGRKLDQVIATAVDAELGQELNRTRSCLGALVGLEWESSLYARLDPAGRYENTLQGLKALLKAESLRQPVVLLLEDVHWLDEDSQEFMRRLGRGIEAYPLAVLATARPERSDALLGRGCLYRQVELACLPPQELAVLAEDRLGGPVAPEMLYLLVERAESNPFFTEQILLYLGEQGWLACQDGIWSLATGKGETPLPEEVRAIFIARLDRLAKEVQQVVQAAAILGREFEVRVLAHMLRADLEGAEVPAALAGQVLAAEQEAIWAALTELRYLFKHLLLRDAAYEMQLKARRRELHRLAAEALERLYGGDLAPHYGEIAYHYEAACRQGLEAVRGPACHYLELAGRRAAGRYENAAAVDWHSRALELIPPMAEEQRLGLLLAREAVYHLLGRREAQRADLQALQKLVEERQRPAEQVELALRQTRLSNATGNFDQAQAQAQAAVTAAQIAGGVELEASAHMQLGGVLWRQANHQGGLEHCRIALQLAQSAGRKDLQAEALLLMGNIASSQEAYAAACQYYEQALILCRETGKRQSESAALSNLGIAAFSESNYPAARQYLEQALPICREIGFRAGSGMTLNMLGNVALSLGDLAAASQYLEQALAIFQDVGDRRGEGIVFNDLGNAASSQKDYATAQRYYEQASIILHSIGLRIGESWALNNLGEVASFQGNYAEARRYCEQALALSREINVSPTIAENLAGLALVALAQGDQAGARTYILEMLLILDTNPTMNGVVRPRRALLKCVQVLLALGDARGQAILTEVCLQLQKEAGQMDEDARRMLLENVPENRELLAEFTRLNTAQTASE